MQKQKIVLTQSSKYQFSHLLKLFQLAAKQSPQCLQAFEVFKILSSMGFLPEQPSEQDYELSQTIAYMLAFPQGHGTLTQRNLFYFLMNLTEVTGKFDAHFQHSVQPLPKDIPSFSEPLVKINLGTFTQDGKLVFTPQESKELRQIFKQMIYTKASRNHLEILRSQNEEQQDHQPKILSKSITIAQEKFKKSGIKQKVQDRLLQAKRISMSRIQSELKKSREKELLKCSFKPTINSFSFSLQKENEGSFNRGEVLMSKGRQYGIKLNMKKMQKQEFIQKQNLSTCSFHPNLKPSQQSLRYSIKRQRISSVKNEETVVSRMRLARDSRDHLNQIKNRGYPEGISWLSFLKQTKNSLENSQVLSNNQETQSIILNLELYGNKFSLEAKVGQNLETISNLVCNQCNIPQQMKGNLFNLIKNSINNSESAAIKKGKICIKQ